MASFPHCTSCTTSDTARKAGIQDWFHHINILAPKIIIIRISMQAYSNCSEFYVSTIFTIVLYCIVLHYYTGTPLSL